MKVSIEEGSPGWHGVLLGLSTREVDILIQRLTEIRNGQNGHFHIRRNEFDTDSGIYDIEFSIKGESEDDNMTLE